MNTDTAMADHLRSQRTLAQDEVEEMEAKRSEARGTQVGHEHHAYYEIARH